jgi:GNAT superfamily N-acetyltransferase
LLTQINFTLLYFHQMKFRRILPNEVSLLTAMARRTFADAFEALNTPEDFEMYVSANLTETALGAELSSPDSAFWWVCHEEQLVAYFKLNQAPAQTDIYDPASIELERIYTLAEWQGHGIGSLIIEHVENIARQEGMQFIWLGVWEKNHRAIAFYERHGFRPFGSHVFKLGTDEQTDVLLRKDLA